MDLRKFIESFTKGIPSAERDVLATGSSHPGSCRCETCRQWWQLMGPSDDDCPYGPFKAEEIEDDSVEGQRAKRVRLMLEADRKTDR